MKLLVPKIDVDKFQRTENIQYLIEKLTNADSNYFQQMNKFTGSLPEIYKFVDRDHLPLRCLDNAKTLASEINGQTVKGWNIFIYNCFATDHYDYKQGVVQMQQHMLVRGADNRLYDSTPVPFGKYQPDFGFFYADSRLRTSESVHYTMNKNNEIGWGSNIFYFPRKFINKMTPKPELADWFRNACGKLHVGETLQIINV